MSSWVEDSILWAYVVGWMVSYGIVRFGGRGACHCEVVYGRFGCVVEVEMVRLVGLDLRSLEA